MFRLIFIPIRCPVYLIMLQQSTPAWRLVASNSRCCEDLGQKATFLGVEEILFMRVITSLCDYLQADGTNLWKIILFFSSSAARNHWTITERRAQASGKKWVEPDNSIKTTFRQPRCWLVRTPYVKQMFRYFILCNFGSAAKWSETSENLQDGKSMRKRLEGLGGGHQEPKGSAMCSLVEKWVKSRKTTGETPRRLINSVWGGKKNSTVLICDVTTQTASKKTVWLERGRLVELGVGNGGAGMWNADKDAVCRVWVHRQ